MYKLTVTVYFMLDGREASDGFSKKLNNIPYAVIVAGKYAKTIAKEHDVLRVDINVEKA